MRRMLLFGFRGLSPDPNDQLDEADAEKGVDENRNSEEKCRKENKGIGEICKRTGEAQIDKTTFHFPIKRAPTMTVHHPKYGNKKDQGIKSDTKIFLCHVPSIFTKKLSCRANMICLSLRAVVARAALHCCLEKPAVKSQPLASHDRQASSRMNAYLTHLLRARKDDGKAVKSAALIGEERRRCEKQCMTCCFGEIAH